MTTATLEKTDLQIDFDESWNVVFHNDDKTTMEFVIAVLMQIFNLDFETAKKVMFRVHEEGKAIVTSYPSFDIAEQKSKEAMLMARAWGYPLKVTVEK